MATRQVRLLSTRHPAAFGIGLTSAGTVAVAAGTQPFTSGDTVAPGGQLWLRSATAASARLGATGPVTAHTGTLMKGDPAYKVQWMTLAALSLRGKSGVDVGIEPGDPPRMTS
ncbi:hypothetical protein OG345_39120 [Streptomyces sp. NBC_01220]|uniref:hypothetical protein n=1 Tax=Streptomyces sp. NBC_01220 TaxID=2903781 RepID=UPI00352FC365|nr:hypothetical protein OG345_39120 [Streptomyces sp. NBC_01220]